MSLHSEGREQFFDALALAVLAVHGAGVQGNDLLKHSATIQAAILINRHNPTST